MELRKMRSHRQQQQLSWRSAMVRKLLNRAASNSDYSADSDSASDSDEQEFCDVPESRFKNDKAHELNSNVNEALPRLRRRNSETFRAQYINSKEIRICAATWNVGGELPPDDLDLESWLDTDEPADIYVIGFQEIIPLNAGNIFGAEDNRPIPIWENIIRETLNRVPPQTKFKSFSDPPSPSRFKPCEDAVDIVDEVAFESDSDIEEGIHPVNEETWGFDEAKDESEEAENELQQFSSNKRLDRLHCLRRYDCEDETDESNAQCPKIFSKTLSGTERIGLSWPEPPLDLLGQHILGKPTTFGDSRSFKTFKSFRTCTSLKSNMATRSELKQLVETDLESLINRKRRPSYVRIVSKQMVGVFITIWVRRGLRRYIQNLSVSTVGVGVMGYIGNKGAISVSMSVHQTMFCFICAHLTAGEKEADAMKRNADVQEIHRRTSFNLNSAMGLPRRIYDHERIIWLGDLNYRINLSYERTTQLISKREWSKLVEKDQLMREFRKGGAFDGWSEGSLRFAPTYKYELDSDIYYGQDPKLGRRTPAWCDRVVSFGTGMRVVEYKRCEIKVSDHRPVTASYTVEVEVFCQKKLQRALTFTDAEMEQHDNEMSIGMPTLEEEYASY